MARPHSVRDEARFRAMWLDLTVRQRQIMAEFDICWDSVNRTARRLGLPYRAQLRQEAGMNSYGPMRRRKKDNRGIYQPRSKDRRCDAEPAPTLFRCEFCGGPSTDQEGHSGCISRNQPKGRAA